MPSRCEPKVLNLVNAMPSASADLKRTMSTFSQHAGCAIGLSIESPKRSFTVGELVTLTVDTERIGRCSASMTPSFFVRFPSVTHRHPDHFDPQAVRKALGENGCTTVTPSPRAATSALARATAANACERR